MNPIEFDLAQAISILVGFVIPVLVGLLSKLQASSTVKALLNFGLSALTSVLASVNPEVGIDLAAFAFTFALTWATSIATYYGLYKPTGAAQAVQRSTAGFGVGG